MERQNYYWWGRWDADITFDKKSSLNFVNSNICYRNNHLPWGLLLAQLEALNSPQLCKLKGSFTKNVIAWICPTQLYRWVTHGPMDKENNKFKENERTSKKFVIVETFVMRRHDIVSKKNQCSRHLEKMTSRQRQIHIHTQWQCQCLNEHIFILPWTFPWFFPHNNVRIWGFRGFSTTIKPNLINEDSRYQEMLIALTFKL